MTPNDKLYIERVNGHYEAWTYSDGQRVQVAGFISLDGAYAYARTHGYNSVEVQ